MVNKNCESKSIESFARQPCPMAVDFDILQPSVPEVNENLASTIPMLTESNQNNEQLGISTNGE